MKAKGVFKKTTDMWTIGHEGVLKEGLKHGKAMEDIRHLLRHQERKIPIEDLPGNEGFRLAVTSVEVASRQDGKRLLARIAKRPTDRPEGQPGQTLPPDKQVIQRETDQEIDALNRQYNENFDLHGYPRTLSGDKDKTIKSSDRRFRRLIEKIQQHIPALATQLGKKGLDKHEHQDSAPDATNYSYRGRVPDDTNTNSRSPSSAGFWVHGLSPIPAGSSSGHPARRPDEETFLSAPGYPIMDKKAKKKLHSLNQRLQRLRQQLAGARRQADHPAEASALEKQIAEVEAQVAKLKQSSP